MWERLGLALVPRPSVQVRATRGDPLQPTQPAPCPAASPRTSFSWESLSLLSSSTKLSMAPVPGPGPGAGVQPYCPSVSSLWSRKRGRGRLGDGRGLQGRAPSHRLERRWSPIPGHAVGGSSGLWPPRTAPTGHVHTGDPVGCFRCRGLGGEDGRARPLGLHAPSRSSRQGRSPKLPAPAWCRDRHGTCAVRLRAPSWRHLSPCRRGDEPQCITRGRPPAGCARLRCWGPWAAGFPDAGRPATACTAVMEICQPSLALWVLLCVYFTSTTH